MFAVSPVRVIVIIRLLILDTTSSASSIVSFGTSASTTTADLRWLLFASASSVMMASTADDQPRIKVWPLSATVPRPRRSASNRPSRPVVMTPIKALTMKMPPIVAIKPTPRTDHPLSPPIVPASKVRISADQPAWMNPLSPEGFVMPPTITIAAQMTISTRVASARSAISGPGPRAIMRSNQNDSRRRREGAGALSVMH